MSELWLLRHTEPLSPGLYIGRGSDPPLSPKGRQDALSIAENLSARRPVPEILCSSPQKRAVETVNPLSENLGRPIEIREGLSELDFGDWEGFSWQEIRNQDGELWQSWLEDPWRIAPPGGETLKDLRDRVICEVEGILSEFDFQLILLAGHGGPIRTVLGYALNLDPSSWWRVGIDYGSMCCFRRKRGGGLDLLQWNVPVPRPE